MAEIRSRLRDLGIAIGTLPTGPLNAITDVPGVKVGHCTVSWGGPELARGQGPARTGVTAILPHDGDLFHERLRAGVFAANGVGELVGSTAIREWGLIETPIVLTDSQGIGVACDATVRWMMARDPGAGSTTPSSPSSVSATTARSTTCAACTCRRSTCRPRSTPPRRDLWPRGVSAPAPA